MAVLVISKATPYCNIRLVHRPVTLIVTNDRVLIGRFVIPRRI